MARARSQRSTDEEALVALLRSIARGDAAAADTIAASPELVRQPVVGGATRNDAASWYLAEIEHYVYAGDTPLHIAAAAYHSDLVPVLLAQGALVSAKNRRGAEPLHYAADGGPNLPTWNPLTQAATVTCLIDAGANPTRSTRAAWLPSTEPPEIDAQQPSARFSWAAPIRAWPTRAGRRRSSWPPRRPDAEGAGRPRRGGSRWRSSACCRSRVESHHDGERSRF